IKPPTDWQPPDEKPTQGWQQPGSSPVQPQHVQPGGWPAPQSAQNWGGGPSQPPYGAQAPAASAPYNAPYAPSAPGGRSRALAIGALVMGACAVTIMLQLVFRTRDFTLTSLLVLAILGIGLGVASLIVALQKPARFGGIPLAIAGLAMGTAALVYYFTR
ncbi:MAG TPA: hypothetical protein VM095_21485, partial [Pyrinomonadaceae bacterium]|nr:hypothetical protein [Pyrinomonadaceae bacterium]